MFSMMSGAVYKKMLASFSPFALMKEVRMSAAMKIDSSFVNFSLSFGSSILSIAAIWILLSLIVSLTKVAATVCFAVSISRVSF